MTVRAAGILFRATDNQVLFLKRGAGGDRPGEWCFPGGRLEGDETPEDAAKRETVEEIGSLPDGERSLLARRVKIDPPTLVAALPEGEPPPPQAMPDEVDFTTFLQQVPATFEPTITGEHVGFAWAPADQPPEPLHPGCRAALARLTMDDLGVAEAIRDGDLVSPQRFHNVTLVAMRISGTSVAYRSALNEFVYRHPDDYLTDRFLARCNGLPVIMMHPKGAVLDSKEFSDRIVGTMFLPYLRGDEVWGIAKIYDDATIEMLGEQQLSTSPSVVFVDPKTTNTTLTREDGSTLLIEGKPALIDHLAICQAGVWDKGGEPTGIDIRGDAAMTDEEKAAEAKAKADAEEKAKADAEAGTKLDKILDALGGMGTRMDAFEKRCDAMDAARKDSDDKPKEEDKKPDSDDKDKDEAAKLAADKARKDAEDEKEKERADAARADSERVQKQIADLAAKLPVPRSDDDRRALADAQARADDVFQAYGDAAPRFLDGEMLIDYRKRLAAKLQGNSNRWAGIPLADLPEAAFAPIETQIYADAAVAAKSPTGIPEGTLRPITRTDSTGRRITEYHGTPGAWMSAFKSPSRRARIDPQPARN